MVNARIWAGTLLCAAAVAFTGCATDDTTSQVGKFLASDRGPDDVLPTAAEPLTNDAASSRHVGDYDGISYFVTKYVEPETQLPGFCLVLVKPGYVANSGCVSERNATRMRVGGSETGSARVVVADDLIPQGWTKVGDFLIVNPNIVNPDTVNPNIVNPDIVNPNIVNPDTVNPSSP
jgi:hypothetical protein